MSRCELKINFFSNYKKMGNKPTKAELRRAPGKSGIKWKPNPNNITTPNYMKIYTAEGNAKVNEENARGERAGFNRKNKCKYTRRLNKSRRK
jgi:hypothetical protein